MEEPTDKLTLECIKEYARIDSDDEDDILNLMLGAARKYVCQQIGSCDESDERVRVLLLAIISNMYDNRVLTVEKNQNVQYVVNQMIMQLQFEHDKEINYEC